jgi:hypothetical protein
MFRKGFRWTGTVIACCLIAVMAFVAIQAATRLLAQSAFSQPASPAPPPQAQPPAKQDNNMRHPLLRALSDLLADEEDVSKSDKDEAQSILEEADTILMDIKEENRRALEDLRR